jgi:hypothetical protein
MFTDTKETEQEYVYKDEYVGHTFRRHYNMKLWPKHVNNLTVFSGLNWIVGMLGF